MAWWRSGSLGPGWWQGNWASSARQGNWDWSSGSSRSWGWSTWGQGAEEMPWQAESAKKMQKSGWSKGEGAHQWSPAEWDQLMQFNFPVGMKAFGQPVYHELKREFKAELNVTLNMRGRASTAGRHRQRQGVKSQTRVTLCGPDVHVAFRAFLAIAAERGIDTSSVRVPWSRPVPATELTEHATASVIGVDARPPSCRRRPRIGKRA